jgi:hypothetical protein
VTLFRLDASINPGQFTAQATQMKDAADAAAREAGRALTAAA